MRLVSWNMAFRSHGQHHDRAWAWVLEELRPDLFLCQEAIPPDRVTRERTVIWERAYPTGPAHWGTGLVTSLPCTPARIPGLDAWLQDLPQSLPGQTSPARIHRADGWLAAGRVVLPSVGETLIVSVHNPWECIEGVRLTDIDVTRMKLKKNDDLWLLDVLFYFVRPLRGQRLIVGGDFNYSRLLDKPLERGNNEFFDRIRDEGFVSIHRRFHPADEQTYFTKDKRPHQLDYLYADAPVAEIATACAVHPHAEFSDHAALIADFEL